MASWLLDLHYWEDILKQIPVELEDVLLAVIKSSRTEMAAGKVKSLERVCLASREISSDHPLPLSPDPTYLVFPGPVCSELSSLPPPSTLKAGFQLHPGEPSKNTNMTWLPCYSL